MPILKEYLDTDFITIQDSMIHWHGYFYYGCGWHMLEYGGFFTSVKDFIEKYGKNPVKTYEEEGVICDQYLRSESDGPKYTEEWFQKELDVWLVGATHIDPNDITLDISNGYYVLKKGM